MRANARQESRFFAPLRMTLVRPVILNEVKDLSQNDPLPTGSVLGLSLSKELS